MKHLKHLLAILLLTSLTFIGCDKKEDLLDFPRKVTFSGSFVNYSCKINGQEVTNPMSPHEVKKGDIIKMTDTGNDINHPPVYLYPSNGGSPILVSAGYNEQGYTEGYIIMNNADGTVGIVAQYQGNGDVNLSYTVK